MKDPLKVFATTDLHGHFEAFAQSAKVQQLKNAFPEGIWIDNGDFFIGNSLTTYYNTKFQQSPLVEKANAFSYDVMVPGNHDLDYGLNFLKRQVSNLNIPYVCCNLMDMKGEYLFDPYTILERNNKKIAVIGLMTEALPQLTDFKNTQNIICEKAEPALKRVFRELPADIDLILVSYHGGLEVDLQSETSLLYPNNENQAYAIAQKFPQIDGLLAGHQHFFNAGHIQESAFVQPGSHGKALGVLTFTFNEAQLESKAEILPLSQSDLEKDPGYIQWLDEELEDRFTLTFLSEYFDVDQSLISFKKEGKTRRDFLEAFSQPYTFYKYNFTKEEWDHLVKKNILPKREFKTLKPITIYSNDPSLPYYRITKKYIDNLFDAFHQWQLQH